MMDEASGELPLWGEGRVPWAASPDATLTGGKRLKIICHTNVRWFNYYFNVTRVRAVWISASPSIFASPYVSHFKQSPAFTIDTQMRDGRLSFLNLGQGWAAEKCVLCSHIWWMLVGFVKWSFVVTSHHWADAHIHPRPLVWATRWNVDWNLRRKKVWIL